MGTKISELPVVTTITTAAILPVVSGGNTSQITVANYLASTTKVLFNGTANNVIANTTSETSIVPTGIGSMTIAGGTPVVGRGWRLEVRGHYSTKATGAGTKTMRVKFGGTTLVTTTQDLDPNATNKYIRVIYYIVCRSTGDTGTVYGHGATYVEEQNTTNAMYIHSLVSTSTSTVNTNNANLIDVTMQLSVANASNSFTWTHAMLEQK